MSAIKSTHAAKSAATKVKTLIKGVPKNTLNLQLEVSTGRNARDNAPTKTTLTIRDLVENFCSPDTKRGKLPLADYLELNKEIPEQKRLRNQEKDGHYIIVGAFAKPGTRSAKDIKEMCGFMIDLDQGNYTKAGIEQIMGGTFCIAFSTYSHHPQDPRWRIVVPYVKPIPPQDHHKTYVHFNELFGGNLDPRCDTTAQIWYTPACPPDAGQHYEVFVVNGDLLDPDTITEAPQTVSKKPYLPAKPNCMSAEVERVRSALTVIPSDDRDIWVKLGIALKQNLPTEVSYDLWAEWSKKSEKFDPYDAEVTWKSFKDEFDGNAITLGSVFHYAKQLGWNDTYEPMHPAAEIINQSHFAAFLGGKNRVFAETYNYELQRHVLQSYALKDFSEHFANQRVLVTCGRNVKDMGVVDLWYRHPARRTYKSIVFMPGMDTPLDVYNTWRGFAVDPSPGNWDLLKQHMLDNICKGDTASYDYLLRWMAFAVQHPDKRPGVAVVLQGAQGTGKGKLASLFMKLFGSHAMQITQSSHIVGKFNYHLRDCVLLFMDEALWAGDKAGENVLKGLITEEYLQVEKKFADVEAAPNRLHVMMASNNDWVIPAGAHERRYFVLKVGDAQRQNNAYFHAIDDQILNKGGLQAMMHELLQIDLSSFNISAFPRTAALDEQKLRTLAPEDLWWMDHMGQANPATWQYQPRSVLAASFAEHGGTFQNRQSQTRLGQYLKKVVPGAVKKVNAAPATGLTVVPSYEFPDLAACKAAFVAHHGFAGDPWA